ncbi:MAG: 16S rRNA (guanine(527)-N(7))-methyltransferase RsmG [Arcobacter sp.]|uniref:16S rRNA (guanine(527)-N(7))-methyltransferase RsmG n=1 Tax=Arcobacter sp. TaxID=1872629 RepID=UPI003AFF66C2
MVLDNLEDLNIDKDFLKKSKKFKEILQHWGRVHNLSAELEDIKIDNNIYDSIYVLKFIKNYASIADIGTGAGYPGLILAMARPNIKFYLIEPRAKRVAFLNFVKNSLKLENVEILCNRVEYVKDIKVELITSRAVTNTALLLNLTKDISDENTSYLFYKGSMLESELEEAKIYNYKIIKKDEKRNYLYINKGVK